MDSRGGLGGRLAGGLFGGLETGLARWLEGRLETGETVEGEAGVDFIRSNVLVLGEEGLESPEETIDLDLCLDAIKLANSAMCFAWFCASMFAA